MHLPILPMYILLHSQEGVLYTTPSCFRGSTGSLGCTKCNCLGKFVPLIKVSKQVDRMWCVKKYVVVEVDVQNGLILHCNSASVLKKFLREHTLDPPPPRIFGPFHFLQLPV